MQFLGFCRLFISGMGHKFGTALFQFHRILSSLLASQSNYIIQLWSISYIIYRYFFLLLIQSATYIFHLIKRTSIQHFVPSEPDMNHTSQARLLCFSQASLILNHTSQASLLCFFSSEPVLFTYIFNTHLLIESGS